MMLMTRTLFVVVFFVVVGDIISLLCMAGMLAEAAYLGMGHVAPRLLLPSPNKVMFLLPWKGLSCWWTGEVGVQCE